MAETKHTPGPSLEILRKIEWAGLADHPEGGHYSVCLCCGGGDPHSPATPEGYAGHGEGCELASHIAQVQATGGAHG